jgi:hypothetical protein
MVKVIFFDDFKNEFETSMTELCEFIGVDENFTFHQKRYVNSSSLPRFAALGRMVTVESKLKFKLLNYFPEEVKLSLKEHFNNWNTSKNFPTPIKQSTRNYLIDFFSDDINNLQSLLKKDLTHWLKF